MKDSVRDAFVPFTDKFEGTVNSMYLDVKGLVTVAIGNLIDPAPAALTLPFLHADGTPATRVQIAAEWHTVKADTSLAKKGWTAAKKVTRLHLDADGIKKVVQDKLFLNEYILKRRFPEFEQWPADAQLGLLSMAWACGANFNFPKFEAACKRQDFLTAAAECRMAEAGNPGLIPRNVANKILFTNAAKVLAGISLQSLVYPGVL